MIVLRRSLFIVMSVGPNELDLEPKGLRAKASRARLSEPLSFVEPDSYHQLLGGVSTIFLHRPDCQKEWTRYQKALVPTFDRITSG